MARQRYSNTVARQVGEVLSPLEDVMATVTLSGGGEAQVYESQEGGAAAPNPMLTDAAGSVSFWAEPGSYVVTYEDTLPDPRIDEFEDYWDSISYDDILLLVPTGTMLKSALRTVPSGFLKCDGSAVSRTTYVRLWNALRTDAEGILTGSSPHGNGNESSTFNLPNEAGFIVKD